MNASHAIVNEEPVNERHDGADLCPMCLIELLLPANSCPKCGAPVNAAGIIEPPVDGETRLRRAKRQFWLSAIIPPLYIPSVITHSGERWIYVALIGAYLIMAYRFWRDYQALKTELEPTST